MTIDFVPFTTQQPSIVLRWPFDYASHDLKSRRLYDRKNYRGSEGCDWRSGAGPCAASDLLDAFLLVRERRCCEGMQNVKGHRAVNPVALLTFAASREHDAHQL